MPSTFTTNLGIEKPGDGEQDGVWGDIVNENSDILDRAVNGVLSLSLSGTASTLTTSDGLLSNGQFKLLVLTGTPSGTHTITIAPSDAQKIYYVRNTTAQSVIFTQGSGGDYTLLTGDSALIYSNGVGAGSAVANVADHLAMSSPNITGGTATLTSLSTANATITGGSITGITDLALADGGTGASTAADARTNLGLGTLATQASSSVSITGGSITGITDLTIADGGTGASTAANARTNLGLGTIATQASNSVSISGGSITGITDLAIADGGTGASTAGDARTNLGLGTISTQASSSVSITGGSITGITDLAIADGGTGSSTAAGALTNLGLTATAAELNTLDNINTAGNFGLVPSGGIIIWSGSAAAIPTGWLLCNGTSGTPNLRDRFVVGAGTTYAVGATGGATTVSLVEANLPAHTHGVGTLANSSNTHSHTLSTVTSAGGTIGIAVVTQAPVVVSASTTATDTHSHTISGSTSSVGSGTAVATLPPYYALCYIMKS